MRGPFFLFHIQYGANIDCAAGPQTTTETRLISRGDCGRRQWDNSLYEDQLFYFNTVTRVQRYEHGMDVSEGQGLDRCFDCTSEIFVLRAYLKRHRPALTSQREIDRQVRSPFAFIFFAVRLS